MKISVSLDSHAVIAQPPLRLKASSFAPVDIAFTRGAQNVRLAEDAVIEIGLKSRGKPDAPLLVFHSGFEATAGNLYSATVDCATAGLINALGLGDGDTTNDKSTVDLDAEVGWFIDGQLFRSQTFPVVAEAPIVSPGSPAPLALPGYPPAANILTKEGNLSGLGNLSTARSNLGLSGMLLREPVAGPISFNSHGSNGQFWFDAAEFRLWLHIGGQWRFVTLISEA